MIYSCSTPCTIKAVCQLFYIEKNSWVIIAIVNALVSESSGQLRFGRSVLHLTGVLLQVVGCGLSGLRFGFCFAQHVFILWFRQKGQQLPRACFSRAEAPEYRSRANPHKHIYDFCLYYSYENTMSQVK